jgi:threonine synthase
LRESHGRAIAVSDEASESAMRELHEREGIDATEEGGATLAALRSLVTSGVELPSPVVLFNTATSLKYAPR